MFQNQIDPPFAHKGGKSMTRPSPTIAGVRRSNTCNAHIHYGRRWLDSSDTWSVQILTKYIDKFKCCKNKYSMVGSVLLFQQTMLHDLARKVILQSIYFAYTAVGTHCQLLYSNRIFSTIDALVKEKRYQISDPN